VDLRQTLAARHIPVPDKRLTQRHTENLWQVFRF
jgi:hypothetical protein